MRLLDGSIRAAAESWSTLESLALSLSSYVYFPDSSVPTNILSLTADSVSEFWDSWVFQESARRTMLFASYFTQIHRILQHDKNIYCSMGPFHSWYLSAHLWNAQNAFDFALAWTEKDHFVLQNYDFTRVLQDADANDFDLFGKMLLVGLVGIDEAKAWFFSRGGIL